jgi:hypothetical protein
MSHATQPGEREGLLQRFFHFYAIYLGVTEPPPAKQKIVLAVLLLFFTLLIVGLVLFAEFVAHL